jgi:K+-sensing histidine kinase KdpD
MSQPMPSGGRLRTYLGIAPGVGKTYEMLRDARARRRAGVDAVVAYRERHGRAATAAQLADLEVVPTRTVTYRGVSFDELDVTAVLDRGPELALVDELAHANLPGERHAKRWQDVAELLASELHGTMVEVRAGDVASGLIRAARQAGACQLVIGSPPRSRWSRLLNGSAVADQVLRAAGDLPVQVVNVGRTDRSDAT